MRGELRGNGRFCARCWYETGCRRKPRPPARDARRLQPDEPRNRRVRGDVMARCRCLICAGNRRHECFNFAWGGDEWPCHLPAEAHCRWCSGHLSDPAKSG